MPGANGSVSDRPVAQFSATPQSGAKNLVVQFVDESDPGSSPIIAWAWDFGDGNTSTAPNPIHTYTVSGSYTVSLSVQTSYGLSLETKTGYIVVTDPIGPSADFTSGPSIIAPGASVFFGDASLPGSLPVTGWLWDFGDGNTSTLQSPAHVYALPGVYTVSLTVTTGAGSDTETKADLVAVVAPAGPDADFTSGPSSVLEGGTVYFGDTSLPGSLPVTGRLWDFGDGNTSTAQSPAHAYANAGVYSVSLTVTTGAGSDTEVKTNVVTVVDPEGPTVDFTASPATGLAPLDVQFVDMTQPGDAPISSWLWSFGDGETSTLASPVHTYAAAGTYSVTLEVTTALGTNTLTRNNLVVVAEPGAPSAAFTAHPLSGTAPLSVQFGSLAAAGSAPIVKWEWDFGDGQTSLSQSPLHVYNTQGTYAVTLTVTDANNNVGQSVQANYVTVGSPAALSAAFSSDVQTGSAPLAVAFTDQSTPGSSPVTQWEWDFGDGEGSTAQNPSHTYTEPGAYTVSLTVFNAQGSDTESRAGYITVESGMPAAGLAGLAALAAAFGLMGARGLRRGQKR